MDTADLDSDLYGGSVLDHRSGADSRAAGTPHRARARVDVRVVRATDATAQMWQNRMQGAKLGHDPAGVSEIEKEVKSPGWQGVSESVKPKKTKMFDLPEVSTSLPVLEPAS